MGIFSALKKLTGFEDQPTAATQIKAAGNPCTVDIKLSEKVFTLLGIKYYGGYTSYKSYFKLVFFNNPDKTIETMNKAREKAESGFAIDQTYVHFYVDDQKFIEIPFDVYSDKREQPNELKNAKVWHRNNILRLLKFYPDLKNLD
jgi:hypothetical protein